MRTFEYRLYLNKKQSRLLMACLTESRKLYNEMLAQMKQQYEDKGTFSTKYDLTARFKGRGGAYVPATTVQMLADRLTKSLERFLAAKKLGIPDVGFPRFKKPNRWHSIQLRQYGTSRDAWLDADNKHLHVPAKIGKLLKIKLHRPIEGTPKTVHLVHRADGHWYALIVCETKPRVPSMSQQHVLILTSVLM
jgi:putative transposase